MTRGLLVGCQMLRSLIIVSGFLSLAFLILSIQKRKQTYKNMLQAGTGYMLSLADGIHEMEKRGYTENLSLVYDHFTARSGEIELYPKDFSIDEIIRFENTSDPDDQAILYAISSRKRRIKGLHASSYGLYSEEMSPKIVAKIHDYQQRQLEGHS